MSLPKKIALILLFFILVSSIQFFTKAYSQSLRNVGIGTINPSPSALLELKADSMGFLVPRVSLTSINDITTILNPATSLLVYNTNASMTGGSIGFWYYDGTKWSTFGENGWQLKGNAGTIAGPNFLGTIDSTDFVIKTSGAAPGFERMRVLRDGHIVVNNTTPNISDVYSVYSTGSTGAINSIGTTAIAGYGGVNGYGVFGENVGAGVGVYGSSLIGTGVYGTSNGNALLDDGVWGDNFGHGCGVRGQSMFDGAGVFGFNDSIGSGVYGYNSSNGIAVKAINADTLAGAGYAIYSLARYHTSFGLYSLNSDTLGTGIISIGNNTTPTYLLSGSGGSFNGKYIGLYSFAEDPINGTGILAVGNNLNVTGSIAGGAGVAATGDNIGVYGYARTLGTLPADTGRAGGYFVNGTMPAASYAYVGMFDGTANRKIVGNGTVNTIVKNTNNDAVMLSAPEAPENLFQDYGTGTLSNGKASITLDPDFAKIIAVDSKHPLRVFVQLEGDCKGVYVTNKTQNGFDVIELNSGTSNVSFTWSVIANRADETRSDGFVLKYSQERFTKAPKPLEEREIKVNIADNKIDIHPNQHKKPSKRRKDVENGVKKDK
jgi:hypothetical protein